mmetsp:Transcript_98715/g.178252  ORF Transcript_98715/g.178252 Transcript_98715/m.178252 type:complete len:86 (+) Transcript_98715:88-345(+)
MLAQGLQEAQEGAHYPPCLGSSRVLGDHPAAQPREARLPLWLGLAARFWQSLLDSGPAMAAGTVEFLAKASSSLKKRQSGGPWQE